MGAFEDYVNAELPRRIPIPRNAPRNSKKRSRLALPIVTS